MRQHRSRQATDGSYYYDQLYLSNFATLNVKDDLARIKGVGDVSFLGPRDYSMRIWLDPDKLAARRPDRQRRDQAIQEQNRQVAAGRLGQPPVPAAELGPFQLPINTQGRLVDREAVREHHRQDRRPTAESSTSRTSSATRRRQGRHVIEKGIELGAKNYDVNSYLDGKPVGDAGRLPVARLERARDGRCHPGQDGGAEGTVSRGRRVPNLLRHDRLRR